MKNNFPLVSVVVVCYNHEKYINECIDSIMHQSYTNIEVLVFDNGSTDNSPFILKELQAKYKFKLYFQENTGVPRALNKSIKMVKGKYVSPMSTDDFWPLNRIEIGVKFMENCEKKIAVCGGNAVTVDENSNIFRKQTFMPYHEFCFDNVFLDDKNIPALTALIRRKVLIEVGGYDESFVGEASQMWLKITNQGYRIAYLNQLLGYYRRHKTNISKSKVWIPGYISTIDAYKNHQNYPMARHNMYYRLFSKFILTEKLYAFRFIGKINIRYLNIKSCIRNIIFLLMPYCLIKRITHHN